MREVTAPSGQPSSLIANFAPGTIPEGEILFVGKLVTISIATAGHNNAGAGASIYITNGSVILSKISVACRVGSTNYLGYYSHNRTNGI